MDKSNVIIRRSDEYLDNELFHSDRFLGDEFSDDLYHFKYIKREKGKNGKWRYYYDKKQLKDDLGFDEKERLKEASDELSVSQLRYAAARVNVDTMNDGKLKISYDKNGNPTYDEWTQDFFDKGEAYIKSLEKYEKAEKDFYKTPIGFIPGVVDKVSKGIDYIGRLFGKKKKH